MMTTTNTSDDTRVSVTDAARLLKCTPVTIRRQVERGNLRAIYTPGGRVFYVTRKSFDAFKARLDAMNNETATPLLNGGNENE